MFRNSGNPEGVADGPDGNHEQVIPGLERAPIPRGPAQDSVALGIDALPGGMVEPEIAPGMLYGLDDAAELKRATVVLGRRGVKRKWLRGLMTVIS